MQQMFVFHSCKRSGPLTMLLVNSSCAVSFSAIFACYCALPITDAQSCSHNMFCCVCVRRRYVQQWFSLTSCKPWPWFSVGRMWCVQQVTLSTPPRIYWLRKQARGCRWSFSTTTSSQVCVDHDVYRPPYFAISREMRATTYTMFRVVRFNFF